MEKQYQYSSPGERFCSEWKIYVLAFVFIVIADSMMGEVTPAMAAAVGQSSAKRILLPVNQCDNIVVGVAELSMGKLVEQAMEEIERLV